MQDELVAAALAVPLVAALHKVQSSADTAARQWLGFMPQHAAQTASWTSFSLANVGMHRAAHDAQHFNRVSAGQRTFRTAVSLSAWQPAVFSC